MSDFQSLKHWHKQEKFLFLGSTSRVKQCTSFDYRYREQQNTVGFWKTGFKHQFSLSVFYTCLWFQLGNNAVTSSFSIRLPLSQTQRQFFLSLLQQTQKMRRLFQQSHLRKSKSNLQRISYAACWGWLYRETGISYITQTHI